MFTRQSTCPPGKFNAGEKVWFWGGVVVLSRSSCAWSGVILLFPNFDQSRAVMQDAWIWHAGAALLYIAIVARPHLPRHARRGRRLPAMRTGYVDETWAKEHHEILVQRSQIRQAPAGRGRRRARRRAART